MPELRILSAEKRVSLCVVSGANKTMQVNGLLDFMDEYTFHS